MRRTPPGHRRPAMVRIPLHDPVSLAHARTRDDGGNHHSRTRIHDTETRQPDVVRGGTAVGRNFRDVPGDLHQDFRPVRNPSPFRCGRCGIGHGPRQGRPRSDPFRRRPPRTCRTGIHFPRKPARPGALGAAGTGGAARRTGEERPEGRCPAGPAPCPSSWPCARRTPGFSPGRPPAECPSACGDRAPHAVAPSGSSRTPAPQDPSAVTCCRTRATKPSMRGPARRTGRATAGAGSRRSPP